MTPEVSSIRTLARFDPIEPLNPIADKLSPAAASPAGGAAFGQMLDTAIETVARSQQTAATEVSAVLEGKKGELHWAVLATQRAELQFQYFLQMRNKVVNAYQEIMRVQI